MALHNLLRLLISLSCWCHLARSEPVDPSKRNSTGILEVDLVFPQNKTYSASPHMPIVFAFRNTGLARFLDAHYTVNLTRISSPSIYGPDAHVFIQHLSADELAWDDPHFTYNSYEVLRTRARDQWLLSWTFNWTGCVPARRREHGKAENGKRGHIDLPAQTNSSSVVGGQVAFTVYSAYELNITEALGEVTGAGAAGGVALRVEETLPAPDNTTFGWGRCAVVADATEVREPSPITIGADAAESISLALESTHCVSPADGWIPDCLQSRAPRLAAGGVASAVLFAVGFGWLAYFAMFSAF